MLQMYKGAINSPETIITNNISNTDTLIYVQDETKVPTDLPNLMVIGTGISAETIKVLSISGLAITVERAFQGTAKTWNAGTTIARNFTEYDYEALKNNVEELADNQGDLATLITTDKTNLVGAVNELVSQSAQHAQGNANKAHGGFKGALVKRTSNISIANTTYTSVPFQESVYDNSMFFNATNPTRLTIPEGVTKVKLKGFAHWSPNNTGVRIVALFKNGNIIEPRDTRLAQDESSQSFESPTFDVIAGDYFEMRVFHARGSALDLRFETYFAIEVVE
ncbi:hypothetical protein SAMN02745120_1035 [Acetoanaerobium noterae]|uniref:Uncharacterized protein n=1 Tax=Acetoanaerobium noterae TaxID=745369 RepID=A0A1T5AMI0_9FIRM|nr:hypothetical protein [Acetoanaerobium noterae]SKB36241.1 hypothetical protein SAMN02745120_1035 [Acetoanaerobium noterae]